MSDKTEGELLSLIDGIYAAVTEPAAWPGAWQSVIAAFGGTSGSLFAETEIGVEPFAFCGFTETALSLYAAHYWRTDPWVNVIGRHALGAVTLCHDHVPAAQFEATETWQDFSRLHVGAFHAMGSGVHLPDGSIGMFALHREKGMEAFDAPEAARLDRLLPHLRHAMHLSRMARQAGIARHAGHAVLEALHAAAFVVDGNAEIVYANRAAEALVARGPLRMVAALDRRRVAQPRLRLVATDARHATRLQALVARAAGWDAGGGLRLTGDDGEAVRILVMPIPRPLREDAEREAPATARQPVRVLVLAEAMGAARALAPDMLIGLYGFSRAEAAVAEALLRGLSAEAIAAERHVSVATVRSQIRAVLDKTGAPSIRAVLRFLQAP